MKIQFLALSLVTAKNINVHDIKRNLSGNFLESLIGFERGYNYGDSSSLQGLATMSAFMQGAGDARTTSIEAFQFSIQDFIEKFTNYGCYCWILGADKGVIGGGQTRDHIDGLCGHLYKCYKCLNIDFGSQETLFNYDVSLVAHDDGRRELICQDGANKEACMCDKQFAEKLSNISAQCEQDKAAGVVDSPFCINEDFRTETGGGNFDPFDNSEDGCFKNGMKDHNPKDNCCGVYPERFPYDSMSRECCQMFGHNGDDGFTFDTLVPFATCEARGGTVVET